MLKKSSRLSREAFTAAFKAARRRMVPGMQLLYTPPLDGQTRAAVVVPKKVAASAVRRNYLRRRLYAEIASTIQTGGHRGVYIVLLTTQARDLPLTELLATLRIELPTLSQNGRSR